VEHLITILNLFFIASILFKLILSLIGQQTELTNFGLQVTGVDEHYLSILF